MCSSEMADLKDAIGELETRYIASLHLRNFLQTR